jgi:peptide/nickel transport system permease protein
MDIAARLHRYYATFSQSYLARNLLGALRKILRRRSVVVYFLFIVLVILLGLVGPLIAPYEEGKILVNEDGSLVRTESPSLSHPLGTTAEGRDVLSQLLHGTRPTVMAGLLGGTIIITLGLSVGVTAGYVGGRVESVLMRITDFAYSIPLIPFAVVLVGLLGVGYLQTVVIIALLLWRGSARVLRSQVLKIKERPFIRSARASGASTPRIIVKHVLPNVAPMALLFFALGVGYSIIILAGLTFLGLANPFIPSWGVMLRDAFNSGLVGTAWWWSVPPGLMIALTVLSTFMFGRGYESLSGQGSDREVDMEAFSG